MRLQCEWVSYPDNGTSATAYLARPARDEGPLPAVLVIQEIWGVDGHIQDVAERFATAGYLALAPDLYTEDGKRPEALAAPRVEAAKAFLDALPPSAWGDAQERAAALARLPAEARIEVSATLSALLRPDRDMGAYAARLRAAVGYLRALPATAGRRVGCCGFCLGGALSWMLAATEPQLAAAVAYYGSGPQPDGLGVLHAPVLGLYGGEDHRITDGVPQLAAAVKAGGGAFEPRIYAGAPHAFFNDTRASYRPDAARDAWACTLGFLNTALSAER